MSESRTRAAVSPSPREAGRGWVLDAVFPNGKQAAIAGFRTESEANEWLGSAAHVIWLRQIRSGCCMRAAAAAFACLDRCAAVLAVAMCVLVEATRHGWGAAGVAAVRGGLDLWRRPLGRRRLATIAGLLTVAIGLVFFGRGEHRAPSGAGATPTSAAEQPVYSQPVDANEISDPIALLIDRVTFSEAAADLPSLAAGEAPPPEPAGAITPERELQDVTPRHDLRQADRLAIVGVWTPEPGSCSARNRRDGTLLAEITERGARAGETACTFKKQRQTKNDWRVLADCANGHEHWTANVRLTVMGDRLIWTSGRGRQAYTRCRSKA
jgi:hypothetical protein